MSSDWWQAPPGAGAPLHPGAQEGHWQDEGARRRSLLHWLLFNPCPPQRAASKGPSSSTTFACSVAVSTSTGPSAGAGRPRISRAADRSDAWYPMETFERMGLAILTDLAQGDLGTVRIFGRLSIDWLCQTYGNLVAPGDPRDTLMRFQVLRRGFFDYPALEIRFHLGWRGFDRGELRHGAARRGGCVVADARFLRAPSRGGGSHPGERWSRRGPGRVISSRPSNSSGSSHRSAAIRVIRTRRGGGKAAARLDPAAPGPLGSRGKLRVVGDGRACSSECSVYRRTLSVGSAPNVLRDKCRCSHDDPGDPGAPSHGAKRDNRTSMVVPAASSVDCTSMRPPCASTIWCTLKSPQPEAVTRAPLAARPEGVEENRQDVRADDATVVYRLGRVSSSACGYESVRDALHGLVLPSGAGSFTSGRLGGSPGPTTDRRLDANEEAQDLRRDGSRWRPAPASRSASRAPFTARSDPRSGDASASSRAPQARYRR